MLKLRFITAIALITFVFVCLLVFPLWIYELIVIALCSLAFFEWFQFVDISSTSKRAIFSFIFFMVSTILIVCLPKQILSTLMKLLIFSSLIWWVFATGLVVSFPGSAKFWQNSRKIKLIFGFFTILPFLAGLIYLREFFVFSLKNSMSLLFFVLFIVWASDSGAYFVGKSFGKHKLLPKVSPGKTVEGFFGGFVFALLIAIIFKFVLFMQNVPFLSFPFTLFSAILIFIASVLGDLSESMFKRVAGIKDSGNLIPGHGGILDRVDSLTAAIPLFSCLLILFYF